MIQYLYADRLQEYQFLADSMFRDRAAQFKDRLNWDVSVDTRGWERDQYDDLNPLYLIWSDNTGRHRGSIRCLPTTGRTMLNEHFRHISGVDISSPLIWECTRFCLSPGATTAVAGGLLLGCLEAALRFGVEQAVGVFDARMPRIYGRIGHSPDVMGTEGKGREAISVGIWTVSRAVQDCVSERCGVPISSVASWFDASFNAALQQFMAA